jgi:two-component system, OmpR family, alkaline phosphatase synthesis response regulator PhoP
MAYKKIKLMQVTQAHKVLVADDESDILEIITENLRGEGFLVETATNGDEAIAKAKVFLPDLIILDVMMPKKSGMEACEILRNNRDFDQTIIVFLTALDDEDFEVKCLNLGGDDYITKPVKNKVLVSKINSLLRRTNLAPAKEEVVPFTLDPEKFEVKINGEPVALARKEFDLLLLLQSKPGKVFQRSEILNKVWGNDIIVGDRTIDVHIRKIRSKLGIDCISTLKGVGYKFDLK